MLEHSPGQMITMILTPFIRGINHIIDGKCNRFAGILRLIYQSNFLVSFVRFCIDEFRYTIQVLTIEFLKDRTFSAVELSRIFLDLSKAWSSSQYARPTWTIPIESQM